MAEAAVGCKKACFAFQTTTTPFDPDAATMDESGSLSTCGKLHATSVTTTESVDDTMF